MAVKTVIKRDGQIEEFDFNKIKNAINLAFKSCSEVLRFERELDDIKGYFESVETSEQLSVEQIQDFVEDWLMRYDYNNVAKSYIIYRYTHKLLRDSNTTDKTIKELIDGTNEYWNKENGNKRADRTSTQRDYIAGITSTDIARRLIFTPDVVKAHDEGLIHIHDIDYAAQPGMTNCCLINLEDMLDNGTVINDVLIESPHRFITACTIATQIMLNVSSNQYGGMTISIAHLAKYLRKSFLYYKERYPESCYTLFTKELEDGVQTFNYQLNSMSGSNGQSPFSTVHIDLEEKPEYEEETMKIATEFLEQRIRGFKNKNGAWVTPAFPKIIVVLRDKYFTDEKYSDFIKLCARCTASRMVPDYMSEKNMLKYKGAVVPAMGCRSLLRPIYPDGKLKLYGRLNLGVATINLPHVAYSAKGNMELFWKILDERLALCRKAQLTRVKRIANTSTDCAPTLWQHGVFMRAPEHSKIGDYIYGGYASISLGYAGLYECTKVMTGESHSTEKGYKFAEELMSYLDKTTVAWAEEDNLGWSVYGTPIESTTYKFAKSLKQFGYDRDYITNSIHIPVFEEIDPFEKLKIEGKLQKYSTGGNVNYIESADMNNNLDAIIEVMKAINDYSLYAEINGKSDYCLNCGSTEEQLIDENMEWYCPVCGCKDIKKLYHPRRLCGYIGTSEVNRGRTQDIKERFVHLDNHDEE